MTEYHEQFDNYNDVSNKCCTSGDTLHDSDCCSFDDALHASDCCSFDDALHASDCCSQKHKKRSDAEVKDLTTRLNKIEGQIRGIRRMIDDDRYCVDVLMQVSAVQSALNAFNKQLLSSHIRSCVVDDIKAGNDEAVDELCELLKKTMK